ncbi:MAG TPA: hypothetical protein VMV40_02245 [Acidiferrobacter sp.]|nr:hypothetical protein [Acidiferrobacter sp.]
MVSIDTNVWLRHGPQGILLQRLARYALLGWALFGCAALALCLLAVVAAGRTPPIIAVNREGVVLGHIQWLSAIRRSHTEIVAASMRFVEDYLSVNSDTVVPDYVQALNMMAPPFRAVTVGALQKSAYIARVRKAHLRSWVTFDHGDKRPRVVGSAGPVAHVRLTGVVHLAVPSGQIHSEPFSIILTVTSVPRRPSNTAGVVVDGVAGL